MDYYKSYRKFFTVTSNVQSQTIKDNIADYPILENLFGFHYWLQDEVACIHNSPGYNNVLDSSTFVHATFTHNFFTSYSIFLALERNLLHTSISLKRTILESIVKMNYLAFFPADIDDVLFHEVIHGIRDEKEKKLELEAFKRKTAPQFKNLDIDQTLQRIKSKYSFKWFLEQIYDDQTIKSMKNAYRQWSGSTHASLLRFQSNYNKQITASEIHYLQIFLFYNILAEVEGHQNMIPNQFPYVQTKEFIDKMTTILNKKGGLPLLFPDNPTIASKVIIHPPGKPWE